MTRESVDFHSLKAPQVQARKLAPEDAPYRPFDVSETQPVPPFLPLGAGQPVRQTSSTHGPDGYITMDAQQIDAGQRRLMRKIEAGMHQFVFYDEYPAPSANTLLITYGVTARAAKAALMEKEGAAPAALLVLKTLWPVPEQLILAKAADHERIVVLEMNMGQYVREIQRLLPHKEVQFFGQMNGELIRPGQIIEVLDHG